MKSLCNRRVSVWNPDTLKEIVRFVHEVHPVYAVTLSTFLHMLCGWNDGTMPTFNLFRVHLKCFSISPSFSSLNKSVNDWKTANDARTCWKLMTSLWMMHTERKNRLSSNKFKNRLKCLCNRWVLVRNPDTLKEIIQFVHDVRPVFAVTLSTLLHMLCGWNDDTMPSFENFQSSFCSDFQFHGHLAL